jgi:hypothetical protein
MNGCWTTIADRVAQVAKKFGVARATVALASMLGKRGITSPIVGATKMQHLRSHSTLNREILEEPSQSDASRRMAQGADSWPSFETPRKQRGPQDEIGYWVASRRRVLSTDHPFSEWLDAMPHCERPIDFQPQRNRSCHTTNQA